MELSIIFKDMEPVEEATERLQSKLQRLEERLGKPIHAKAMLLQKKTQIGCQVRFPYLKSELVAVGNGWDWFGAVDDAVDKLERQLNRKEEQRQGRRDGKTLRIVDSVGQDPDNLEPMTESDFVDSPV